MKRVPAHRLELRVVNLAEHPQVLDVVAKLLEMGFSEQSSAWHNFDAARREVVESLASGRISRIALDGGGHPVGWAGALPQYGGRVWELHPVVVHPEKRSRGVGTALVRDLENEVRARGGSVLILGTDDEDGRTNLFGLDLYPNVLELLSKLQSVKRHPFEFFRRLGFATVGVIPDANGRGRPDILMAKRIGS